MLTPQYTQYVENTITLAKTLVIKSIASCNSINYLLNKQGITLSDDLTTWKYYLNLAGIYHSLDTPMTILSLDTLEEIDFTVANLRIHVTTHEFYKAGKEYYTALVERYPTQELLIRGILTPVNLEEAVAAPDHTILYIDTKLIESNETNLVPLLQQRLDGFLARWNNADYAIADDLYTTAYLGILFLQIPGWIANIRLANCKTQYAHTFHIREYLRSHGRLDSYFDYLTKSQMLFLYRNLLYIENNAGKQDTFDWLAQKLLTDRSIGLAEYQLHHDVTSLVETFKSTPEFKRTALNRYHRSYLVEAHSFANLLLKERPLAYRNSAVEASTLTSDTPSIQNARRNHFPTKVLESAIIDWSESGVLLRSQFLLNHWGYWSSIGKYRAFIRTHHPQTNELLTLTALDSFILFFYLYNYACGVTLLTIPQLTLQAIRRQPTPSRETLATLLEDSPLKETLLTAAASSNFSPLDVLNPYQFVKTVDSLYKTFYIHRDAYAVQENLTLRAQYQAVMDHLYMDVNTTLVEGEVTYADWFAAKNLTFTDLSAVEAETLYTELYKESTGIDLLGTFSPADIQRAMISLMTKLSSYAVQFVNEVNPGPIVFWEWPVTRLGKFAVSGTGLSKFRLLSKNCEDLRTKGTIGIPWNVEEHPPIYGIHSIDHTFLEQPNLINSVDTRIDYVRIPLARVYFNVNESYD